MKSITSIARRTLWPLVFKGAMAAGVALAFYTRYLAAPLGLEETMSGETAHDPDNMSTRSTLTPSALLPAAQQGAASQGAASQGAASQAARSGRLTARPVPVKQTARRGLLRLGLGTLRDGLIYIPAGYQANRPAPLVLSLHGAGGNAQQGMRLLQSHADRAGFIVLAVESRRSTWDVLLGGYGPDVQFINRALTRTFGLYAVDPARIAVAGFSDGASYALSLGITNGDLFRRVMAFSPGFMAPQARRGQPRIFIAHGKRDRILPIEKCSRRIVPQLQHVGYRVRYREFDGPHTLPTEIKGEAVSWWFARGTSAKA